MNKMNQFLRIANARLKKVYPNKMQRKAWAAKMYARWLERKTLEIEQTLTPKRNENTIQSNRILKRMEQIRNNLCS